MPVGHETVSVMRIKRLWFSYSLNERALFYVKN